MPENLPERNGEPRRGGFEISAQEAAHLPLVPFSEEPAVRAQLYEQEVGAMGEQKPPRSLESFGVVMDRPDENEL